MAGWTVDAVGGLTLGADPVSYAIAHASALAGTPVRAFTVRKEAKTHGTGKVIEGPFFSGDTVVIIEDVITTGASALRAWLPRCSRPAWLPGCRPAPGCA